MAATVNIYRLVEFCENRNRRYDVTSQNAKTFSAIAPKLEVVATFR